MMMWTQKEIGTRLGVDDTTISKDLKNSQLGKIQDELGPDWNDKGLAEWAERTDWGSTVVGQRPVLTDRLSWDYGKIK